MPRSACLALAGNREPEAGAPAGPRLDRQLTPVGGGAVSVGGAASNIIGIAFDAAGDLYIADTLNSVVRRVVRP